MDTLAQDFNSLEPGSRPRQVARNADRSIAQRRIVRFTLDLEREQHNYLKSFSGVNGVKAALVMRALLSLMETNPVLAQRVIDFIFDEEDADYPEEENAEE